MNSGERQNGHHANRPPAAVDPADQWVLDPATGEFRLDLDAAPPPAPAAVPRPRPTDGARDGGRSARRQGGGGRGGRRRVVKWTAGTAALVLVAGCGGALYAYQRFTGNLSSVEVAVGPDSERPQAATGAMNILVIGTDSRQGLGREYGDEGSAGHADTTLLMHVAKDRSNATVMSIPRDLMVTIPECEAGGKKIPGSARTLFNESLGQEGRDPGCTWRTVEKTTGIRIDHFLMVDFEAVKSLSTAVGGVEVCVAKDINDSGSHLKLAKGRHVVQGEQALAFVRTRHAVGQGSDLSRIELQQQFLSSMIRKMKSSDTLTNPAKLFNLADAATKALTVDAGLKSVDRLKDLALDLSKVDTKHITFATVPVLDDPKNKGRVILNDKPAAQLFAMVAADRSLTEVPNAPAPEPSAAQPSAPAPAETSAPAAQVDPAAVRVTVRNGSGVPGQATKAVTTLKGKGFVLAGTGKDTAAATTTTVNYPKGRAAQGAALAAALGLPASAAVESAAQGAGEPLLLVLGKDFTELGKPAVAVPTEAPEDLQRVQADDVDVCAK
ncbi:LCP family protein [Kitasatospora sp. NPDC096147]|uniref:LCP family protein n=1 Tax=Kitasatospora sp. NPDC096147 TaxID=3364093 RepID=UPI0038069017